jgi:hypothetical protein
MMKHPDGGTRVHVLTPVAKLTDNDLSRPAQLERALQRMGVLDTYDRTSHHRGFRTLTDCRPQGQRDVVMPLATAPFISHRSDAGVLALTPVLRALPQSLRWLDLYDDWSLAPEMNVGVQLLAAAAYRAAKTTTALVTVNSRYMHYKIGPHAHFVPNGAQASLSKVERGGDDRPTLIVMGGLRRGRTDFALIRALCSLPSVERVLIGGPGTSELARRLQAVRRGVEAHTHLDWVDLAKTAGPRAVGLVSSAVSDYTLSQDPLKAYDFLALGMPVVCPRLLWPESLPRSMAMLVDHNTNLSSLMNEAFRRTSLGDPVFRERLATEHSWQVRAEKLVELGVS